MSVTVKNTGASLSGNTLGGNAAFGDQGTVRVEYQGLQYIFAPNESKTFSDDGIGKAVAAADSRLTIAGQPQGFAAKANASLSYQYY